MVRLLFLLCWGVLADVAMASAQAFTAMEGSVYGGAVNTAVQPASGSMMPYRWDVEVIGIDAFWNNNIFSTSPFQWRRVGDSVDWNGDFVNGSAKRWMTLQGNVHLLNFLFRWPGRNDLVVGAGWNIRSATSADRLDYAYNDSMKTMNRFLEANAFNRLQQGRIIDQQWSEWYITASKIIRSDNNTRVAVGGTLKLVKGMGAIVIDVGGLSIDVKRPGGQSKDMVFTYASGRYGYSQNLEDLSNEESNSEAWRTLFNGSPLSPSLSFGISYLVKKPGLVAGFVSDEPAGYDWKLDASLTDIGRLKYPLGRESVVIKGVKGQPELSRFARILDSASTLSKFNDSLSALADLAPWQHTLSVSLPTALHIHADKNLGRHFFMDAGVVLDMSFLNFGTDYKTSTTSYLMLTPRWEIQRVGVYAPVYVNAHGSVMAGAALRLGPLIAGVHDFGWLFHNSRSGGAYVALVIRGLLKGNSQYDCPVF